MCNKFRNLVSAKVTAYLLVHFIVMFSFFFSFAFLPSKCALYLFHSPDSISLAICGRRTLKLESSNHVCVCFLWI